MVSFFLELSIVIILAFGVALLMHRIKQPLLIGYMLAGLIAGPIFLDVLVSREGYESFARIGIALLLFIVGLHLNFKMVKEVGLVSIITGLGQILFTTLIGSLLVYFLGFSVLQAGLIAIALTFSSTIIVIKLLTDRNNLDKLFGKISVGLLLIQDLVAVVLLMVLSSFMSVNEGGIGALIIETLIAGCLAFAATVMVSKFVLPRLVKSVAKSTELLFVFIIAWCLGIAALFEVVGFSIEIGALVAGIALASSPYQHEMSARIKPLRDFFIIMFFIFLGYEMIPSTDAIIAASFFDRFPLIWHAIEPIMFDAIILSLFVLLVKPLIVLILVMWTGYTSKTGFMAGFYGSQISEFSIIVSLMALETGVFTQNHVSLIAYVALITITISTYIVKYIDPLYKFFAHLLQRFEKKRSRESGNKVKKNGYHTMLFGHNRIGYSLLKALHKKTNNFLVVDHNPDVVRKLQKKNVPCVYGDLGNIDFVSDLDFKGVKLVASTIPDFDVSALLLESLRSVNKNAAVVLTADHTEEALELYEKGADYVILPHFLGGHYVSTLLHKFGDDPAIFTKERDYHLTELQDRKATGHHTHPQGEHL